MFFGKTAGVKNKYLKMFTCIVLAICVLAAAFSVIPFFAAAKGDADNTRAAVFIGKAGENKVANTFIPVDIPSSDGNGNLYTGTTYFKLTFACKMLSGTKPIVGVLRVRNDSETGDKKTFSEPLWCDNANDVTLKDGVCTAYFKVDFNNRFNLESRGNRSFYITVGNAEHDGNGASEKDYNASFIMSDAKLVTCDAMHNVTDSKNKLPVFSEDTIDFGGTYFARSNGCEQYDSPVYATSMFWHIDSAPYLVKQITVPYDFNESSNFDAANFTLHAATDNLREYYTNAKYDGVYFEKLANSDDKGFAIISNDLNKKFVFIDANHKGEPDNTTNDGYVPTKNKVGNIFIPLTLGQYVLKDGATANQKVLAKVTFKATRIEGDGPPVLGRVVGKNGSTTGTASWAWGLSTINVRGSGYYTSYNRSDNGGGVRPQCTFNAETGEYVGWVGFETANYATSFGTSEVLTIGNAEHVYQTGTFDSTSFNSSFAISDIKVDLYDVDQEGNTYTPAGIIAENIAPALTADTIDSTGDWYFDFKNGASDHDKDLIRASQQKWHIDGEKSLVSFENMDEIKAYSRKYSITQKGGKGTVSTFVTLEAGKTYQYVFKNKYDKNSKEAKPLVEFVTKSGIKTVDTSNYKSDRGDYYDTVCVFKTPSNLVANKNVRLGIDFTSTDISGTFGGFEIFEIGKDGMAKTEKNIIRKTFISEEDIFSEYSKTAEEGVWMKSGTVGDTGTTLTIVYKEDSFYAIPSEPKMLIFSGQNKAPDEEGAEYKGGLGTLTQNARIAASKRYRFSANLKYAGEGLPEEDLGFTLYYYNKAGSKKTLVSLKEITDKSKYLVSYDFDSPSSLLSKGANFTVLFKVPSGFVSGYLANISLTEIDAEGKEVGENLITNGDFSTGDGTGWEKAGTFYVYQFHDIPENFFSTNPAHSIHALQYRDTGDYQLLQQMVGGVKANTRYELTYKTLVTGYDSSEPYGIVYQKLWEDETKSDSSWTYMLDNEKNSELADPTVITTKKVLNEDKLKKVLGTDYDSSEVKDQSILVKKVFTTSDMLRISVDNNLSVRFYFMTATSGYISDYTLYELDKDGKRVGSNIILDADFSSGDEYFAYGKTVWDYTNDGVVRNIKLHDGFFENYSMPQIMMRSDGSAKNQTYGNQLFVDPYSRYYFSGYYVKTNFEGLNPEVLYRSIAADGEYVKIDFEEYFDSIKYYFETEGGFVIPDDALINSDGKADIIVRLNNRDYGKGYFCGLSLTQDNSSENLFKDSKATLGKFIKMDYDPEIFKPFEGDDGFEDGNWSGEAKTVIPTGGINGTVIDEDEYTVPDITMKLTPGNLKSTTDDNGTFSFDNLKPGKYSLYLIEESTGEELFCTKVTVKAGILITLPDIVYHAGSVQVITSEVEDDDNGGYIEIDDGDDIVEQKYGALKGYCYDSSGKLLSGIDIYVNSKSHHTKTNSKGIFTFEKVPPGKHKICTILEDGSVYVFRTVNIEAGKGTVIRVMMPDADSFPTWAIIAIIAGGVCVLGAGVLTAILLILRKKRKSAI